MANNKLTLLISIASFGLLYLVSCKKDPKCDRPSYIYLPFDKKDTTLLPYIGRDTLHFQYKVGNQIIDTFTFIGAGKIKGKDYLSYGSPEESCIPEMEGETMDIKYNCIDTNLFFTFSLRINNSGTTKSYIDIGMNYNNDKNFGGNIPSLNGSFGYQYKKINLNGVEYYNAGTLYRGNFSSINISDTKNTVIVNSEFGLLQLMIDSTKFWNRIDK